MIAYRLLQPQTQPEFQEVPEPHAAPCQVVVKVADSGLCHTDFTVTNVEQHLIDDCLVTAIAISKGGVTHVYDSHARDNELDTRAVPCCTHRLRTESFEDLGQQRRRMPQGPSAWPL